MYKWHLMPRYVASVAIASVGKWSPGLLQNGTVPSGTPSVVCLSASAIISSLPCCQLSRLPSSNQNALCCTVCPRAAWSSLPSSTTRQSSLSEVSYKWRVTGFFSLVQKQLLKSSWFMARIRKALPWLSALPPTKIPYLCIFWRRHRPCIELIPPCVSLPI
jgi:hypothetical protein